MTLIARVATSALDELRIVPLWNSGQVPGAQGDGPLDAPFLAVFRWLLELLGLRVKRYRLDKRVEETDTLDTMRKIFAAQG